MILVSLKSYKPWVLLQIFCHIVWKDLANQEKILDYNPFK